MSRRKYTALSRKEAALKVLLLLLMSGLLLSGTACGEDKQMQEELTQLQARVKKLEGAMVTPEIEEQIETNSSRIGDLGLQAGDLLMGRVNRDEKMEQIEGNIAILGESMANTHHLATGNQQDVALLLTTAGIYEEGPIFEPHEGELNDNVVRIANCLADDVEAVGSLHRRDTWVLARQRAFWLLLSAGRYPTADTIKEIAAFVC